MRLARILTGLGLFAGVLALLLATSDPVGYTRDESFYFHHAKVYANWFTELGAARGEAGDRLLSNEGIERFWRSNWEHPPLMKVLFGQSWRWLGEKRRPVSVSIKGEIRINELGISHGFQPGSKARILAPLSVEDPQPDSARFVGEVTVTKRTGNKAISKAIDKSNYKRIAHACRGAEGSLELGLMGPCVALEESPTAVLSEATSFRFPGMVLSALLVVLLFAFGLRFMGAPAAAFGALSFVLIPQVFFHSHLACFDMPITALNFAVLLAFWRAERGGGLVAALLCGALWGLALLCKNNAFFLPVGLLLYFFATWRWRAKDWSLLGLAVPRIPTAFFAMALLGPLLLYAGWPLLWHDPLKHMTDYLSFHMRHEHYLQAYFGEVLQTPPFPVSYPFVLSFFMLPPLFLALLVPGLLRFLWAGNLAQPEQKRPVGDRAFIVAFVLINMALPICIIALPSTPIFGGLKHWLLTLAFAGLLVGLGFQWLLESVKGAVSGRLAGLLAAALFLLLLAPSAVDAVKYAPAGTSYFNELIGGVRGAAAKRMQRQFWSYASRQVLPYLNRNAETGAKVDFQDSTIGTCDMYRQMELLRHDLKCVVRNASADWYLFDVEERFAEEEFQRVSGMKAAGPVAESSIDGVPLVRVYRRGDAERGHEEAPKPGTGLNGGAR